MLNNYRNILVYKLFRNPTQTYQIINRLPFQHRFQVSTTTADARRKLFYMQLSTKYTTLYSRPTFDGRNPRIRAGERDWLPQDHAIDYPKNRARCATPAAQTTATTHPLYGSSPSRSSFYEASFRTSPRRKWIQFAICNFVFNMLGNLRGV